MLYLNRKKAGEKLAQIIKDKYIKQDVIVYSLPRGGVILGIEIAKALKAPLDLIINRKIGHPYDPEFALAVISENGSVLGDDKELKTINKIWLDEQIVREKSEIVRRRYIYLNNRKLISPRGKIAIIVDDGIATGLTMKAAVRTLQDFHPAKIVIAVPVITIKQAEELKFLVDDLITSKITDEYELSVGSSYIDFPQITDNEVISLLKNYHL